MSTVVMHNVVSVDGYIADDNDDVGPLFDWYSNGDTELTEGGGPQVSQASADYVRPMRARIGSMVIGRHLFDMANGWEGTPPAVVVSHRAQPDGWHPEASYHFVDDVAAAIAKAKELAGERTVAVAAGDVGGQALALTLVDEVAMDVVPVVFGSGKRYFGPVDGQHPLEDPDVVIRQGPGAAPALPGSPLRGSTVGTRQPALQPHRSPDHSGNGSPVLGRAPR
jgi:dihydrofolate reductase